jgi:transmembrane sensor
MKKTNLDSLLHRYITGQVTEQEKIKIEAWLDIKKTDEGTDLVLDEADEERLFRKITSNITHVEEIKAFRPVHETRSVFSNRWLQVAAAVLIMVAASFSIWLMIANDTVQHITTGDKMEKVILEDGTLVWLREQSQLTYVNQGAARNATLAGEAFFEVAKDPARPFTVLCGGAVIKVVGTSFNLKSVEGGVELKVLSGKVNFRTGGGKETDVLKNEVALYKKHQAIQKLPMGETEAKEVTANTEYDMAFKNTALQEVSQRIEKKFNTDVIFKDPVAGNCRITADFTDHSLERTLAMIAELLEIEYSIVKRTVVITGKGCP